MEIKPIKSSLARYLFVALGATLAVASLGIIFADAHLAQVGLERQTRYRASTIARGIQFATEGLIEAQQTVLLERVVQNYATLNDVIAIELVNPKGKILASSPNDHRSQIIWQPVRQQIQPLLEISSRKGQPQQKQLRFQGESIFIQILPFNSSLFQGRSRWGLVIVVLTLKPIIQETIFNSLLTAGLSLGGIFLVLSITLALVRQRLLNPLQQIEAGIKHYSQKQSLELPFLRDDEIGFLGRTLQDKFAELERLTAELDNRVNLRTLELQQAQEFLQTILDYLPVALFVKDATPEKFGTIILWNQTCERIFGIKAEAIVGKNGYELYPQEQADFFYTKDQEAVKNQVLIDIPEESAHSPILGNIYVHTIKVPLYNLEGNPQYILCISEDITLRKQAQDALKELNLQLEYKVIERTKELRQSEARYHALMNGASDAILIADIQGNFIEVNQKAVELLGYSQEEITQMSVPQIHPPEAIQQNLATFQSILNLGSGKMLDTLVLCKDGFQIPVDITGSTIEYEGKQLIQELFRDITEQKQAKQELQNILQKERELNQLKSQFINIASHEFQNPLTVIIGSVRLIINHYDKLNEAKKNIYFDRILDASLKIKELIEEILLISRIDAGKLKIEPSPINIIDFSQGLVEDVTIGVETVNSASQLIHLDEKILRHILSNLLNNAIKYSPQGGEVKFFVQLGSQEVIFQISDRGIGIPEEDLPYIFESFHRAANVSDIPGTGLGLHIVKKYTELLQGSIEVESSINQGSTFRVKFPLPNENPRADKNRDETNCDNNPTSPYP
jgi:PAS domain S-box-containing protein